MTTPDRKTNRKLVIELTAVIALKLVAIFTICFVFFGPETKLDQNSETVEQGVLMRVPPQLNQERTDDLNRTR